MEDFEQKVKPALKALTLAFGESMCVVLIAEQDLTKPEGFKVNSISNVPQDLALELIQYFLLNSNNTEPAKAVIIDKNPETKNINMN